MEMQEKTEQNSRKNTKARLQAGRLLWASAEYRRGLPMSIGSYFVSEESEKAAQWDALEEFRKAKRHRDSLTDAMLRLGKALGDFAYVLQHPKDCAFDARPNEIVIGKEQRAIARVDPTHFDWETVSRLIADYVATLRRIAELEPRFRDLNGGTS